MILFLVVILVMLHVAMPAIYYVASQIMLKSLVRIKQSIKVVGIIRKKSAWIDIYNNDNVAIEEFEYYQGCCYFHDLDELKGFEDIDED